LRLAADGYRVVEELGEHFSRPHICYLSFPEAIVWDPVFSYSKEVVQDELVHTRRILAKLEGVSDNFRGMESVSRKLWQ